MKKPQDPRNHGLKEPSKTYSHTDRVRIGDSYTKVHFNSVMNAWNKIVKDFASSEFKIIDGPYLDCNNYSLSISFTAEGINTVYDLERAAYDAAMLEYETKMAEYLKWQEEQKKNPPDLLKKIERAKKRLANLEAHRDGKALPFPEE